MQTLLFNSILSDFSQDFVPARKADRQTARVACVVYPAWAGLQPQISRLQVILPVVGITGEPCRSCCQSGACL